MNSIASYPLFTAPTKSTPFIPPSQTNDLSQLPPVFRDFRGRKETNRTSETNELSEIKQAKQTFQYDYNRISRSPENSFTINGLGSSLPLLLQNTRQDTSRTANQLITGLRNLPFLNRKVLLFLTVVISFYYLLYYVIVRCEAQRHHHPHGPSPFFRTARP